MHDNLTHLDRDNPDDDAIEKDLSKFKKMMAAYQLLGGDVPEIQGGSPYGEITEEQEEEFRLLGEVQDEEGAGLGEEEAEE